MNTKNALNFFIRVGSDIAREECIKLHDALDYFLETRVQYILMERKGFLTETMIFGNFFTILTHNCY